MLHSQLEVELMRDRIVRAGITIVLTLVGVTLFATWLPGVWLALADQFWTKAVMVFGIALWTASAGVMWLHVWYDARATIRARSLRSSFRIAAIPRRDFDV
jgi:hypothetical protein